MSEIKYPKYFKTGGKLQNGKLGPMKVSNGYIEVLDEAQMKVLEGTRDYRDGVVIPVGLGQNVEIMEDGKVVVTRVPNRFQDAFNDEEMTLINGVPDDAWEEVLENIRATAVYYGEEQAIGNSEQAIEGKSEEQSNSPSAAADAQSTQSKSENSGKEPSGSEEITINDFVSKAAIQQELEVLGAEYPNKATKAELFEIYLKAKAFSS